MCVCARAYIDVAQLHCLPTLFELHKVRGKSSAQVFTENSVLQEHRWALIIQIVQRIHDYFKLIEVDTPTNKGIKGGERGANGCEYTKCASSFIKEHRTEDHQALASSY